MTTASLAAPSQPSPLRAVLALIERFFAATRVAAAIRDNRPADLRDVYLCGLTQEEARRMTR